MTVAESNKLRTRPAIDRFTEKVTPEPMSGCWLWTRPLFLLGRRT